MEASFAYGPSILKFWFWKALLVAKVKRKTCMGRSMQSNNYNIIETMDLIWRWPFKRDHLISKETKHNLGLRNWESVWIINISGLIIFFFYGNRLFLQVDLWPSSCKGAILLLLPRLTLKKCLIIQLTVIEDNIWGLQLRLYEHMKRGPMNAPMRWADEIEKVCSKRGSWRLMGNSLASHRK